MGKRVEFDIDIPRFPEVEKAIRCPTCDAEFSIIVNFSVSVPKILILVCPHCDGHIDFADYIHGDI